MLMIAHSSTHPLLLCRAPLGTECHKNLGSFGSTDQVSSKGKNVFNTYHIMWTTLLLKAVLQDFTSSSPLQEQIPEEYSIYGCTACFFF